MKSPIGICNIALLRKKQANCLYFDVLTTYKYFLGKQKFSDTKIV
jgi:hypothetical protein